MITSSPSPHPDSARLGRAAVRCLARVRPWDGFGYRVCRPRYGTCEELLNGLGSRKYGGRWNPLGSFPTVYAGLEPETALEESLAQRRQNGLPVARALPLVVAAFAARLGRVLDLGDGGVRRSLGVSLARMRDEPWRAMQDRGEEAITQALGRVLREAGCEGLLVPSFARPGGVNLVVFADRLAAGSRLAIVNPDDLPGRGGRAPG